MQTELAQQPQEQIVDSVPESPPQPVSAVLPQVSRSESHKFRHFKALMRKNSINWKRTWCGSSLEIICPIILMFIITWARTQVTVITSQEYDIYQIKKPMYPTNARNETHWSNTNYEATKQGLDLIPFMQHNNYTPAIAFPVIGTVYEPLVDPIGPYYFFPPHCYARTNRYVSPIVAYIPNGNQIEKDMIEQLTMLFKKQRYLYLYSGELIKAMDDPTSPQSIAVFLKLLDGGTPAQQVELLTAFGVPQPVITLVQLLAINNQTQGLDPYQTSALIISATTLAQDSAQLIQNTILSQSNATSDYYQQLTVQQALTNLGLDTAQTQTLLTLADSLFLPQTDVQSLSSQLQLNDTQTAQLQDILQTLNASQQMNVAAPTKALIQLAAGNITQNQFFIDQGQNFTDAALQVGLSANQITELQSVVAAQQNVLVLGDVIAAQNNATQLSEIASAYSLRQDQVQLLNIAVNSAVPISLELSSQLLNYTDSASLVTALQSNTSSLQPLVPSIQQQFLLNQTQLDQLLLLSNLSSVTPQNRTNQFFNIIQTQNQTNTTPNTLSELKVAEIIGAVDAQSSLTEQFASFTSADIDALASVLRLSPASVTTLKAVTGQPATPQNQTANQTANKSMTSQQITKIWQQSNQKQFGQFRLQAFKSRDLLDQYITDEKYGQDKKHEGICFGFQIFEHAQNDYELDLIFNDLWPSNIRSLPNQKVSAYKPTQQIPDLQSYGYYVNNGFAYMQNWVANTILRRKTIDSAQIVAMIVPTKITTVTVDGFATLMQMSLTLFFLLMYIPLIYRTVYRIVFEKVTKAKESMRIMGLTDFPYWASWFCYYTLVNLCITTGVWLVLNINAFNRASALALWIVIFVYGQSLFGLIMITQSFFQAPRAAAITTTVVYFGLAILGVLIQDEGTPFGTKFAVCLWFPQIAMIQTVTVFVQYDTSGIPITQKTWGLQFQNFSVQEGIFLMIVSGFMMLILGWYLEKVMPKTFGTKKHFLFCIGCPWRCRRNKPTVRDENSISDASSAEFETRYLRADCFEPAPFQFQQKELTQEILKVADLMKTYDNGFKAVNGMNLKMYADQIFVLLGHNGAGKTTTISMLTGLLNPTSGSASIFGVDLFNKMDDVRRFMGVCPQHDVLFELLTTQEHLSFFYDLKGANPDQKVKNAEIEKLMKDCGVYDKRNALAYQLSGGNKRKLSVAIALCGNSKFVLLDEPTSGMDLQARRQLWNILKQYKKDRIIVLTTHYMDEADILGDRIGIMAKGKMTCLGSSIFLKNKFGVGYNLTVVKNSTEPNQKLMSYLRTNLGSEVDMQSEIQAEMTIQIPLVYASHFAEFFADFDTMLPELGIQSYGISISTLEEVFLRIGHLDDPIAKQSDAPTDQRSENETPSKPLPCDAENAGSQLLMAPPEEPEDAKQKELFTVPDDDYFKPRTSISPMTSQEELDAFNLKDNVKELDTSFMTCLVSVLFKRFSNYRRNRKAFFNEVVVPAAIVVIGFGIAQATPAWLSPSRIQTLSRLPQPQQLLVNSKPLFGNYNMTRLTSYLPQPSGTKFDVTFYNGDQNLYPFGQAVYDLGQMKANVPPYMYGAYQVYEADNETQQYKFTSFVNTTSQDATALYPQFMYEAILKAATGDPNFQFKLRSSPFPPTFEFTYRAQSIGAAITIFITAISYSVMMTAVVSYLVVERIDGLKHLQEISGMQLKAYWVGNFIIDFIKMQLTIAITIICFQTLNMGITSAWVIYLLFPIGALPFTYITSFIFSADSAAQTFTMFFHFLTISILSTVSFALRLAPEQQLNGDRMNFGFKSIPTYPIASSVYCDVSCSILATVRKQSVNGTGRPLSENVWDITNNLADAIVPVIHLVVWSALLIMIEKGFFRWMVRSPNQQVTAEAIDLDDDVQREADRIKEQNQSGQQTETIQVCDLKKVYSIKSKGCLQDKLTAVSNLSFSLQAGECFALLGVNGAGKSTTFKSLTHEVKPTSGRISIAGYDISTHFEEARKLIGYCPQPNLIFDTMSVEEHIYYYARIKGIPASKRKYVVEKSINQLGLQDHRKKPAGTLSGGNKRKLCVAQALVGSPPIILLDEPSAGMDPEARRFMWSVVAGIAQKKTSAVVLTTHSMEEAEALSTKMGIMVKGGIFKCFGSAQHIRDKFGTGYVIELKTRTVAEADLWGLVQQYYVGGVLNLEQTTLFSDNVIAFVTESLTGRNQVEQYRAVHCMVHLLTCIAVLIETFAEVEMLEHYGNYVRVRVQRLGRSIGSVFGLVEQMKGPHEIENYSVSQTTLEQIFQAFADVAFSEKVVRFGSRVSGTDEEGKALNRLTIIL